MIAVLVVGLVLMDFTQPSGDRGFAVVAGCVFAGVVAILILLIPVLHCPNCGRATAYFDNYFEWTDRLTGGFRRRIQCKHCHSMIDRLSRTVVAQLPRDEGDFIIRLSVLMRLGWTLRGAGYALVIGSVGLGAILVHGIAAGVGIYHRAGVVLLGCGIAFATGFLLAVAGHRLRCRARRLAEERGIEYTSRVRSRW